MLTDAHIDGKLHGNLEDKINVLAWSYDMM